ncbi:MAG: dTDP-4-dehydrorhamnose reductase [Ignavibacteriae bacterium]|nr:MAG: dTDP-4-dehydrorhamnose reductase [Ignavibacteriota bacterium]
MKRILICGANGLLGQRLSLMLSTQNDYEVLNTSVERSFVYDNKLFDYNQLDITSRSDVKSLLSSFQPDVILNAAAATNVDWCELNREEAWKANVTAVENLAEAARKVEARLVHISTDYIFDGKNGPYDETAKPNPLGYYGKTKLASENVVRSAEIPHTILRTIVLYGSGFGVKTNFALWIIKSLKAGKQIQVVDDQVGNPTFVSDLAMAMIKSFELGRDGIFHVGGGNLLSRYDFALETAEIFGLDASFIKRIKTSDLVQASPRPMNSGFITLKAETQLNMHFLTVKEGLNLLKHELQSNGKN